MICCWALVTKSTFTIMCFLLIMLWHLWQVVLWARHCSLSCVGVQSHHLHSWRFPVWTFCCWHVPPPLVFLLLGYLQCCIHTVLMLLTACGGPCSTPCSCRTCSAWCTVRIAFSSIKSLSSCSYSNNLPSPISTTILSHISSFLRLPNSHVSDSLWKAVIKVSAVSPASCRQKLNFAFSKIILWDMMKWLSNLSRTVLYVLASSAAKLKLLNMSSEFLPMEYSSMDTCRSCDLLPRSDAALKR